MKPPIPPVPPEAVYYKEGNSSDFLFPLCLILIALFSVSAGLIALARAEEPNDWTQVRSVYITENGWVAVEWPEMVYGYTPHGPVQYGNCRKMKVAKDERVWGSGEGPGAECRITGRNPDYMRVLPDGDWAAVGIERTYHPNCEEDCR